MPKKTSFKPVSRRTSGSGVSVPMGTFTNAEQLKNNFFAHTSIRQAEKISNDGTYWNNGRCEWGGSHNLTEDCQALANFFNSIANINSDIQEMTLATSEQDFSNKKQALVNKIQDCISKCQTSDYYSLGNICCIWNDFFGSFLKNFLNNFQQKLQSQLNQLQSIQPVHQKEILRIEAEIRQAEAKYQENFAKAERETDPAKKAKFMALANEALDEITKLKKDYSQNPIASLNKYDYLSDLQRLVDGNISSAPPTQPGSGASDSGSGTGGFGNSTGSNNPNWNPWGGSAGNSSNSQQQWNQQQILMIAAGVILALFLLMNKDKETNHYEEYY